MLIRALGFNMLSYWHPETRVQIPPLALFPVIMNTGYRPLSSHIALKMEVPRSLFL
jgi:hypothetical protein